MVVGTRSELYRRAFELIPGGVNSPVRAWRAVGGAEPFFARRGDGASIEDVDGNRYVDWVMSWGPLIAGHAHPEVVSAVSAAAAAGTSFEALLRDLVIKPLRLTSTTWTYEQAARMPNVASAHATIGGRQQPIRRESQRQPVAAAAAVNPPSGTSHGGCAFTSTTASWTASAS